MKKIFLQTAAAGIVVLMAASCADELNISSIDPKSSSSYDATELLAKQYATLGLTGQVGPTGNSDISGDEGEIGFYRTTFNLQELCTDECIWAWQTDTDIPQITNIRWTSASTRCYWAYQRLAYDITLYNQFISEQEGNMDASTIAERDKTIKALEQQVQNLQGAPADETSEVDEADTDNQPRTSKDMFNSIKDLI